MLDLIRSAGLKGKSLVSLMRGVALLPVSAFDAWRVISRRRPSIVIGVGGYSSGPVVLARGAARHSDAVDGTERDAWRDQPPAGAIREGGGGDVRGDVRVLRVEAFVAGNPVRPEFFGGVHDEQRFAAQFG